MTEAKKPPKLHAKLAEVMAEVGRVPKNGENKQQGYRYVTESDLADAVRQHLSDRGVMLFTHVDSFELTPVQSKQGGAGYLADVSTRHEFVDGETGESYAFTMHGSGIDYPGDKAVYKALTGAVKYALMKTFLIATGDDPEASEEPKRKAPKKAAESAPRGTATEAQIRKLGILASDRGLTKREARLAHAADTLGITSLESFNSLSKEQASRLIEIWASAGEEGSSSESSAPDLSPPPPSDSGDGRRSPPARPDADEPATEAQWERATALYGGTRGAVVKAAYQMFGFGEEGIRAEDVTRGQIAALIEEKVGAGK